MAKPSDIRPDDFWSKVAPLIGKLDFVIDAIAMYYAMIDDTTPMYAKCIIAGALAYFILPLDAIPDFIVPAGYADDAAAIATAFGLVRVFVTDAHYAQARRFLGVGA